ncbi:EAL domain-containing protein [Massilia sp. ZL223]|uniref:EAL domain-containing protein n=1 Tax=Massilia sp. ZL223 TaxID=2824904 RepID=UPI001B8308BF|nr:EAL domain-containing protein [Massilia sp. ZL223]MBQ5964424.1 EAL domain-containing protein [Massilia sp. ZL223]
MNSRTWRRIAPAPTFLALLAGLLLTGLLYSAVHAYEEENQRAAFERGALERVGALRAELDSAVDVLGTVTRVFTTMQPVTRRQFDAFTAPMLVRHPQIELIGWQLVVPDAERAAFEAARRQEFPGFRLSEIGADGQAPAAHRPFYQVVEYLAPQRGNEQALGLDAATRPEIADAARRACASGEAAMTRQFRLLMGGAQQSGFVLLMPVYQEGTALLSGAGPCGQVLGYTTVGFTSLALKRRVLDVPAGQPRAAGAIRLYAAGRADPNELVFVHEGQAPSMTASLLDGEQALPLARTLTVAGQPWHMVISPPPPALLRDHLGSLLVLAGGLLASLGAAAYANMLSQRNHSVRAMVDQRTAELTEANASLRLRQQAIDACVDSIIIARAEDPDFPIEYVNPAFERLNGYRAEEVIGRSGALLWAQEPRQRGVREGAALARERRGGKVLVRTYRKDGTQLWCELVVSPCTGADGKVEHFVIVQHDVTEKRRFEGELEYQATHDTLTGLPNRKLLRRRLEEEIAVAARGRQAVSLLFIDIDRFKPLNDSIGHKAANSYLCAVADRLRDTVREGDTVACLGGDEFVLLLPERTGLPLGGPALERIMKTIAQPVRVDGQELEVSCCIGIARYPADGNDPDVLIDCADRAAHAAKRRGPGNFQFFQAAMNDAAHQRLELERALRGARERGEFDLLYQPWADMASGRVTGVQAKLRWRHPELGLVAPEAFQPIAEESGASIALGAWALAQAAAQVRAWQDAGHGELVLALGVGMRQVRDSGLLAMVDEVLADTGLPARCLRLELAESVLAGDAAQTQPVLDSLRALGVRLAVDRFGNGHTTLADLRRHPIDVIQIDRSLVQDVDVSFAAEAIPDAIISMAHSLGIRVLAEGVDSAAQAEVLARNMCDEVSGALLSEPLGSEAAGALLAAGTALPRNVLRLHKRERTLLLVDDEPNILTALKRQMRGTGCRILTAPSGQEGLALLEREEVDVIVSDQRMPGMTGVEFLRVVKQSHPDTVRIVLSGFTELQSVTDAVNEGAIYKFLTKPWDDTQLRGHIEEAFRHKEMVDENRRLGLELRSANLELAGANRQLEDLLQQQREQIRRDGISLDIVREALQRVPLAILALDEEQQIAYANASARQMLGGGDTLLGSDAAEVIPDVLAELEGRGEGAPAAPMAFRRGERAFAVEVHSMGRGTRSRGTLLTFTPLAAGGVR